MKHFFSVLNRLLIIGLVLFFNFFNNAYASVPEIGAQVWIEPGNTPQQIDVWFKLLKESQMPVARLFLQWNYIETEKGKFDFSLYDQAFASAEKHGIKIVATLAANHGTPSINRYYYYKTQDGQLPQTEQMLSDGLNYLRTTVSHYKNNKTLDVWMLQNEPGQRSFNDPLGVARFKGYLKNKYGTIAELNKLWLTDFANFNDIEIVKHFEESTGAFTVPFPFYDWSDFSRQHLTWYLDTLATEIKKIDEKHGLHVNPHAIFDIQYKYELPKWKKFLSSLGASIHPSWHFSSLSNNDYTLGVSATSSLIRASSAPNPFWITELQGGNNTYSGVDALCPTENNISNWLWAGLGNGANRIIFWCLNWRNYGGEAGEWSMLDFNGQPSERLLMASNIAKTINQNQAFFEDAKPVLSDIYILLSGITQSVELRKAVIHNIEGRQPGAHFKEAFGMYKLFAELGYQPQLIDVNALPKKLNMGSVIVVPHMLALTQTDANNITQLTQDGATLIVTGHTGFFDEAERLTTTPTDFKLKKALGASVAEYKLMPTDPAFYFNEYFDGTFTAHRWAGQILPSGANVVGYFGKNFPGVSEYKSGKGKSLFIPSMVGLAYKNNPSRLLPLFINNFIGQLNQDVPVKLFTYSPNINVWHLKGKQGMVSIFQNNGLTDLSVPVIVQTKLKPKVLFGNNEALSDQRLQLPAEQTVVLLWN